MKENNVILFTLGKRIKFLREQKGMTQLKLSLETGVSKNFISDVENGRRNASVETLSRIASGLGITLGELFQGI